MCKKNIFQNANIMIPKHSADMTRWSVVACDQYTSDREYWESIKKDVGGNPSTLKLVFPEIYLEDEGFEDRIENISNNMAVYLEDDIFDIYKDTYVYVRRTLFNGKVRCGIMGKIDLECYDYTIGATTSIRATEGTVLERIPPRVKVREKCPLELPHVMLLIDDENGDIIEEIGNRVDNLENIYDFALMKESGSVQGFRLDEDCMKILNNGLERLADREVFQEKYYTTREDVLTFAVGDGNHSLATAKKCYENLKLQIGELALESAARYALVELVNLHDESLEFEAIHRVMFDVDIENLKSEMQKLFELNNNIEGLESKDNDFIAINGDVQQGYIIRDRESNLVVGDLQKFIDDYINKYGGRVDYIHGEDVVRKLCVENTTNVGFILKCMDKSELFRTVIEDGALPRKTFSMGEASDKRFYLEARGIL